MVNCLLDNEDLDSYPEEQKKNFKDLAIYQQLNYLCERPEVTRLLKCLE